MTNEQIEEASSTGKGLLLAEFLLGIGSRMTDEQITVITCGNPKDHECDDDGPVIVGGEDENGNIWYGPDTPENRKRARWGSVTCSRCGITAMDRSMWRDDEAAG